MTRARKWRRVAPVAVLSVLLLRSVAVAAARPEGREAGEVRRVLTLLNAVAEEYREAVADGAVVLPAEYDAARLFLEESEQRLHVAMELDAAPFAPAFASVRAALAAKAPISQFRDAVERLRAAISSTTGISEEVFPAQPPSASRGRVLFVENCASCHGERADGEGPDAARLHPRPANFTSLQFMRAETPYDFFHVISAGKGTSAMPAWGEVLSVQKRWDLVAYLWTVPPRPAGLAEAQGTYMTHCAGCHGAAGDGQGPDHAAFLRAREEIQAETGWNTGGRAGAAFPPSRLGPRWTGTVLEAWSTAPPRGIFSQALKPAPPFDTPQALARMTDGELFNAVAHGVPGTSMPAFERTLTDEEMWAVVSFVRLLSLGGDDGSRSTTAPGDGSPRRFAGLLRLLAEEYQKAVPANGERNPLEYTESQILLDQVRRRSDAVLAALAPAPTVAAEVRRRLGELAVAIEEGQSAAHVAALVAATAQVIERRLPDAVAAVGGPPTDGLAEARRLLQAALVAYRDGDRRAPYLVSDAYFQFEPLEKPLALVARGVAQRVEGRFAELRGVLAAPGGADRAAQLVAAIERDLAAARHALQPHASPYALALQSGTIILREGFEVVLIIGALLAYVVKSGNRQMKRPILFGTGAALSLLTAVVCVQLLHAPGVRVEALEGATMLLAAVVLFSVSYWLISKAEAEKWQRYIRGKVQTALARGSALALAGAAFLAVYREGSAHGADDQVHPGAHRVGGDGPRRGHRRVRRGGDRTGAPVRRLRAPRAAHPAPPLLPWDQRPALLPGNRFRRQRGGGIAGRGLDRCHTGGRDTEARPGRSLPDRRDAARPERVTRQPRLCAGRDPAQTQGGTAGA